jgi:serine/threonine protein kinase/tetratricopeptide (TPR) repeat protein
VELEIPSRYELDAERPVLGEGGMGRVLKARDVLQNVHVALKVVRPDLAVDERFRKLFDAEVRVAARFTHPHIVPLHDLGTLGDGTPFLGLALADAGSFASLRDETLPWKDLLRLVSELLDALAHLHARGVLHRDLKPENVLMFTGEDKKRHVWLADLGLANASSQLAKKKGRVEGTPGFMAPEQKLGLPREYGPWTDLFSLGVILWELVSGHLPFPHGVAPRDHQLAPLIPKPGVTIPEGLELVLGNLLADDPLSRYDLAADVLTELEALPPPSIDNAAAKIREPSTTRSGTVAPSAPIITTSPPSASTLGSGSASGSAPSVPDEDRRTMSFDLDVQAMPEAPSFQSNSATWNRPRPKPMPLQPVPEPGFGATARASLPLFALRELPLVARDSFRRVIWDTGRAVTRDGRGRVILVIGEAGTGKTKLVESVARTFEEGGWAETVSMNWQRPPQKEDGYAGAARSLIRPWNETRAGLESRLRRRIARERGGMDGSVHEEAATLSRWCGLLGEEEEPVPAGFGLKEVYRHLEARTWRGLSLMILDDAQWAVEEGDGLAIAEAVLQASQDGKEKRLLVLATIRAEDIAQDPELAEHIDHLVALGARRLDLPRLDKRGTEALLREMLTLAPDLSKRVVQKCEGNPLFARQLLLEWANRGWLVDTGGLQFGLAPGVEADAVMPADAEALFRERIAALSEGSGHKDAFLDALHMVALAGQAVPGEILDAAAGDLSPFMRGSGLWVEKGDSWRFDHGLLHQLVRSQAEARQDKIRLHRKLATIYAAYGEESGVDTSFEVGRHAHAGRDWKTAVDSLLRAAERAWRRGRTKELEEAAALAVDACAKGKGLEPQLGWTKLWQARAFQVRGGAREAGEEFERAKVAFEQHNVQNGYVEALIGMGWAARQSGELADSEKLYQDAMRRGKAQKDIRLEANAIQGLAYVEQQKRNFEGADILFTRVSSRFSQIGDKRGAGEAAIGQAIVARRKGAFEEAEEFFEEAETSLQEAEDVLGVARAQVGRAAVQRQRLQLDDAEKGFRKAMATAEELGATDLLMEARVGLAEIHRLRGDRDRARQIYEAHAKWAEREKLLEPAILGRLGLAQIALLDDDLQAMYEQARLASDHLNKVPGHWLWAPYRLVVATLLALRGDEENTYGWLWSAKELGLADTVDHDIAYYLTIICHVAHQKKWVNVMKVAGKLAIGQWERLRLPDQAKEVGALQQAVLAGA